MSIFIHSTPVPFIAAYKPMLCQFRSNQFPINTVPGISGLPISEIRLPNPAELAAYTSLLPTDVVVFFSVAPNEIRLGMMVKIENTTNLFYNGTYRVTKEIVTGMIVIDTTYADDDAGGTLSRYFEKYTLIAEVRFSGLGEKLVYADFGPDDQKNFIIDVRDIAQRGFSDILSHEGMRPGLPWDELVEADGYITQTYGMAVWPGYMEPDANGVNRFTEFRKDDEVKVLGLTCVNAVQPYHETNINGGIVLSWQEDLVPYLVNENSTGSDEARFLTYAPEDGQIVREGDDVFLAFLWNGARISYRVVIRTYDSSGTLIAVTQEVQPPPDLSGVIRVGPANLGSVITNETASYSVELTQNEDIIINTPITNRYTFRIDRKCNEKTLCPTALNPLGGVDSISLKVREINGVEVVRSTMSKPDMAVDYSPTWTGDYNRRSWAIQMAKTYEASSDPQTAEIRKWFGENIFTSPDIRIQIKPGLWTNIIPTTRSMEMYTSEKRRDAIRFAFMLGVDNTRQRR